MEAERSTQPHPYSDSLPPPTPPHTTLQATGWAGDPDTLLILQMSLEVARPIWRHIRQTLWSWLNCMCTTTYFYTWCKSSDTGDDLACFAFYEYQIWGHYFLHAILQKYRANRYGSIA